MSRRYLLETPDGLEGPFSRDEMLALVERGRVTLECSVLDAASQEPVDLEDLHVGFEETLEPAVPIEVAVAVAEKLQGTGGAPRALQTRGGWGLSVFIAVVVAVALYSFMQSQDGTWVRSGADFESRSFTPLPPQPRFEYSPPRVLDALIAEEVEGMSLALVEALNSADIDRVAAMIDPKSLVDRVWVGVDLSQPLLKALRSEFASLLRAPERRLPYFFPEIGVSEYRFVGLLERHSMLHGVLRISFNDGFDYLLVVFDKSAQGRMKIVDVYVESEGRYATHVMRREIELQIRHLQGVGDIGGVLRIQRKLGSLLLVKKYALAGKFREALAAIRSLPPELRFTRAQRLLLIKIASNLEPEVYLDALTEFERNFPGDPSLDVILIDKSFMKGEWDDAMARVNRLDKRVGGDPYLDTVRATIHEHSGDLSSAKAALRRAISRDRTLEEPYRALISHALDEKDHDETARLLTALERDAGVTLRDFREEADFADFVASDAYRRWWADREAPRR